MHYNEGNWADFVRGLADRQLASEMQSHLDAGCRRCAALAASLAVVEETLSHDRALAVPDEVLQRAHSVFRPYPKRSWLDLPRELAALIFDSSLEPALAGVRSAESRVRHASFEAGQYRIDIRMEKESASSPLALAGQVSSTDPSLSMAGFPIQLRHGEQTLQDAATNEFGEFQFECPPQRDLRLALLVDAESRVLEIDLGSGL